MHVKIRDERSTRRHGARGLNGQPPRWARAREGRDAIDPTSRPCEQVISLMRPRATRGETLGAGWKYNCTSCHSLTRASTPASVPMCLSTSRSATYRPARTVTPPTVPWLLRLLAAGIGRRGGNRGARHAPHAFQMSRITSRAAGVPNGCDCGPFGIRGKARIYRRRAPKLTCVYMSTTVRKSKGEVPLPWETLILCLRGVPWEILRTGAVHRGKHVATTSARTDLL